MSVFLYCYNLEYSCILFFVPCFRDDSTSMIFNVHLTLKIMTAIAKKVTSCRLWQEASITMLWYIFYNHFIMCNISEYVTCTYIIFHNMRLDAILFYKLCALHSLAFAKMLITAPNYKKVIQYHIYFVHHFLYFCKMKSQAIWQQCTGNGRKLSYEWKPRQSLGRHVIQKFVTFALKRIYWNKMLQKIFSLSFF